MDSSYYSFMAIYDNDWGYVLSSEPQTLRQALTSSMSFYKYQSAIGDDEEKEILVYVYVKIHVNV